MGLTTQYLKFVPSSVFNVIGSNHSNVCYFDSKICLVGACENVYAWDLRREEKIAVFGGGKTVVVCIRISPQQLSSTGIRHFAVGYADGCVNFFEFKSPASNSISNSNSSGDNCVNQIQSFKEPKLTFSGHKSAVTCLNYSLDGLLLASGGKDCVAIVWDIVNETGLYKLMGHKAPITQCRFVKNANYLVTSSKDSLIKFWDLASQHCFYTLADHRSEVWDFVFVRNECQFITGGAESELRVFDVTWLERGAEKEIKTEDIELESQEEKRIKLDVESSEALFEEEQANSVLRLKKFGTLLRQAKGRVTELVLSQDEKILFCLGHGGSIIDAFSILNEEQTKEKIKKKLRKLAKKKEKNAEKSTSSISTENLPSTSWAEDEIVTKDVRTRFLRLDDLKCSFKPKSLDFCPQISTNCSNNETNGDYQLVLLLQNNCLEQFTLKTDYEKSLAAIVGDKSRNRILTPGHRSDVRCLVFSHDDAALLSVSRDSLKIWNRSSAMCVRTLGCGIVGDFFGVGRRKRGAANVQEQPPQDEKEENDDCTCASFLLGDRHCVAANKAGKLILYDIGSCAKIDTIQGHEGSISSLCFTPDHKSLITGSSDKTIKFWDFELITSNDENKKKLSLTHTRTLQLNDEVLCCKVTDNGKFLVVGLLDNTAKIYFMDTFKFFLCLYGHSLPVLCLDVSSDNSLIITGSSDKNVKIWGADFGDCHKSLFAHDDSVTCVKFLKKTHLFFSSGKDGKIKQWDADKFEKILVLSGHHSEIWSLAVSQNGKFLASASNDKSIRVWQKTDEILVLQEEQEIEREAEYEKSLEEQDDVVPGEAASQEVGLAARKTLETVKSAEDIIEAMDIIRKEELSMDEPNHVYHPLIKAYNCPDLSSFLLEVIRRVKSSELEKSLMIVPYGYVTDILKYLQDCLQKNRSVELCMRCILFLSRIHHGTLTTDSKTSKIVDQLNRCCLPKVNEIRDTVGYNLAGIEFLRQKLSEKKQIQMFAEAKQKFKNKTKKKKATEAAFVLC